MFLWSIFSPLNEHIQDFVSGFVSEKKKKPICIVRHLQVHLSHAIVMSQLIYQIKITFKPTQPHRPKVFLSIKSIPQRAFIAPSCWCHITFVRKLNPETKISNSLEYSCEWPKKPTFCSYKLWTFPFHRNRCRSGKKKKKPCYYTSPNGDF